MQYLNAADRAAAALARGHAGLPAATVRCAERTGSVPARADGAFSPVEQVWHLCDLEREGFAVRIQRLRYETGPQLPDFDGARIAQQRGYRGLSLCAGLEAFAAVRAANLAALQALPAQAWMRDGS